MQIRIDAIGPEGRHLDTALDAARVAQELGEADAGFRAKGEVHLKADLALSGRNLRFSGVLRASLEGECRRCLARTPAALDQAFELMLRPAGDRPAASSQAMAFEDDETAECAGSFSLEEADEDLYEGDEVDLWPLLREQILLGLPDYLLCDDACRGLCQVCGANLNEAPCGCERTIPDPRLAKLAEIKLS